MPVRQRDTEAADSNAVRQSSSEGSGPRGSEAARHSQAREVNGAVNGSEIVGM